MRIEEIFDVELIEATMKLSYIWPHIHDDMTELETFSPAPPTENLIRYLGVFCPDYSGFFLLVRHNKIVFEIHTVLTKNCRAEMAVSAARSVVEWIFSNTECERLITVIPEINKAAEKLALMAGLSCYGINPHSFRLNGVVQSTKLYGITKG